MKIMKQLARLGVLFAFLIPICCLSANAQYSDSAPPSDDHPVILVPERPVSRLPAKGPGSAVVTISRPADVLRESHTIFVGSNTENFQPDQLVNALADRDELTDWDLSFVDERGVADLVLTLDQVPFTWKFTFKLVHQRLGVVVASGDVIVWDGNLGAAHMAERVIQKLKKVRARSTAPRNEPAKKGAANNHGGS